MKDYNVYAIGNALVDYEIEIDDEFLKNHQIEKSLMTLVDESRQNTLIQAVHGKVKAKQGGGSAANTIIALSKLGGKGYYSCKVAGDEDGKIYLEDLTRNGLDTNLDITSLPEGITGKCLVMVTPDTDRTMNTFLGVTADFSVSELQEDKLARAQYLFIEGYLVTSPNGLEAMKKAIKIAKANNVKVSLTFSDPSMVKYFKDQMKEVVGDSVDLLFCNEEEAMLFTDTENPDAAREALKKSAKCFVVTQGSQGALIWDGSAYIKIDSYPVVAVDSNGAGDMFSGAFLYAITNGYDYQSAGMLASKAASEVVAKFGPRLDADHMKQFRIEILGK